MTARIITLLILVNLIGSPAVASAASFPATASAGVAGTQADAAAYASIFGVTVDEAQRRLTLQPEIGRLDETLAAMEPTTFAGLYITNLPTYGAVALFTQNGLVTLKRYATGGLEEIVRAQTATFSLARLLSDIDSLNGAADTLHLSMSVNVPLNRVEVYVANDSQRAALDALVVLPDSAVVVQTGQLGGPTADIYGGLGLSGCTSGFSVKNASGTKGIVTAAHCSDSQSYLGTSLPFQGQTFGGSHDEQWHTAPGFTPRNRIADGPGSTRPITSRLYAPSQAIGSLVCKFGVTTGYGCGTLVSKAFRPSWVPNANATFHQIQANGPDLSNPGDSGGPVFVNNTAYGIISGEYGLPWCVCDLIYTPIDYVESVPLGISLLTN